MKRPPRIATLLMHFANNDPLAGDLCEEYQDGRSNAWYWRQAVAAVVARLRTTDIRELFAARSFFMQCVMIGLISVCVVFSMKLITVVLFDKAVMRTMIGPNGLLELVRLFISFAVAIPVGVGIAGIHPHSRAAAILAFSVVVPLFAFVNLFVLDGKGNLDAALPHALALLLFITGMLTGGIHVRAH